MGALPALLSFGMVLAWSGGDELAAAGPENGTLLGARDLSRTVFSVEGDPQQLETAQVLLDGAPVEGAVVQGGRLNWRPRQISDGEHHLHVVIDRRFPLPSKKIGWSFTVDTTPPQVEVDVPEAAVPYDAPITLTGTTENGALVEVEGGEATVKAGSVEIAFEVPPLTTFPVRVRDIAGNVAEVPVKIPVELPEIRAVHMTGVAWAVDVLRDPVLAMIDEGRINAVELDLKDEGGHVNYQSKVALANEIGATQDYFDLEEVVEELHALGVRVIGRLVCFRDPILAKSAWDAGDRDQVIQAPGGRFYGKYGGFTNFAHPTVRKYNIDLAVEAAEAGFDEILYDYVRRPDGEISGMVFPGLEATPEESIVSFLAESRARLRETSAVFGVSVFGIAATRPTEIAQDIPRMAEHVDYIAPMVYPSHWGPGEYDVANPNAQPYDIVHASMKDFQDAVAHTDARIVPWLQDFSLGVTYGVREVRAQIEAAKDAGIDEWIMWDPKCTYTVAAYDRRADNRGKPG